MSAKAHSAKSQKLPQIALQVDPDFKKRIEAAAKDAPGSPTVSFFVRALIQKFLDGDLVESPRGKSAS